MTESDFGVLEAINTPFCLIVPHFFL